MKKQIRLMKAVTWTVFVISVVSLVMSGFVMTAGIAIGIYDQTLEDVEAWVFRSMLQEDAWVIASDCFENQRIDNDYGNVRYEISCVQDGSTESNIRPGETLMAEMQAEDIFSFFTGADDDAGINREIEYRVRLGVEESLAVNDKYRSVSMLLARWMNNRMTIAAAAGIFLVFSLAAGSGVCLLAGRREGSDGIMERWFDRLPLFVLLCFVIGIFAVNCALAEAFFSGSAWSWAIRLNEPLGSLLWGFAALILAVDALLLALLLATFAVRVKCRTFWKHTLLHVFAGWIGVLPLIWKSALVYALLTLAEMVLAAAMLDNSGNAGLGMFLVLVINTIAAFPLFWMVTGLKRIKYSISRLANGDISYKTDATGLFGDFKETVCDLNRLSDGLALAVEARTRSERLKTELITNVSHDIKTPLTSIVSYADLIGREETQNEKIREYAAVLSRQSVRLKKLLEDLVEASKAATGNIKAVLVPCDAGVLITQAVGEYEEKLASHDLMLITQIPESPVTVRADGRLTQRVMDNLMNNVCKYAKEGTRVFLELNEAGQVVIKNTSRDLILNREDLGERFVRGESARTSEGNGLGLAIAASLMQTMDGELKISVDGDLFKVILQFGGMGAS